MGQQQLLLIILGTIIVGVAVAGGIVLFRGGAVNSARDAVALDLEDLGAKAVAYFRKPRVMGGGGFTFNKPDGSGVIDISYLTNQSVNNNGRYFIHGRSNKDTLVIVGKGFEVVGSDTIEVEAICNARTVRTEVKF
jgi:hypothetical protein